MTTYRGKDGDPGTVRREHREFLPSVPRHSTRPRRTEPGHFIQIDNERDALFFGIAVAFGRVGIAVDDVVGAGVDVRVSDEREHAARFGTAVEQRDARPGANRSDEPALWIAH